MTSDTVQLLSHEQVFAIVGEVDDQIAADIIKTGATAEELLEAFEWASGSGETAIGEELERPIEGAVAEVFDILTAERVYSDEER